MPIFALKSVSGSATKELVFLAFGQNCSNIWRATYISYYQRQNCSPGILVSSNVRFIWIFAGVGFAREGASNKSGVVVNGDFRFFRSLYLPNLYIQGHLPNLYLQGHNYYIVLCSPLVVLHWRRNGWPWMTLNGHFALKSGSCSASNGLAFWLSGKTVRKFAELRIYCRK